jgi:hypothetical protein
MEIRFYCVHNGKKFYKVILHGEEIFCGTKGECQRFIKPRREQQSAPPARQRQNLSPAGRKPDTLARPVASGVTPALHSS